MAVPAKQFSAMLASELQKLGKEDVIYLRKTGKALVVAQIDTQHNRLFARSLNVNAPGYIPLHLVQAFKPQGVIDVQANVGTE